MLTREQIRAVYDQGPDAVIDFVERLLAIIAEQQRQIDALSQRVAELEALLKTDSHNSNQPPATDGLKKTPRSPSSSYTQRVAL